MIPATRDELYLNNIINLLGGKSAEPLGVPVTYSELFLQNIADAIEGTFDEYQKPLIRLHVFYNNIIALIVGDEPTDVEPLTREELYLKAIANKFTGEETELPEPLTRTEIYYAEIYELAGSSGEETTVTDTVIQIDDALNEPMKLADIQIVSVQSGSGTPSVDNVRPISGFTGGNLYVSPTQDAQDATLYNVTWQTEAGTVYGGHVDLISGLLTVDTVLWTGNTADMNNSNSYPGWKNSGLKALGIIGNTEKKATLNVGEYFSYNTTGSNDTIILGTNRYDGRNQNSWKELAIDVQILIVLPTPQTYQLTPQEISTLEGTNVIWNDTNGETTVTYMKRR